MHVLWSYEFSLDHLEWDDKKGLVLVDSHYKKVEIFNIPFEEGLL